MHEEDSKCHMGQNSHCRVFLLSPILLSELKFFFSVVVTIFTNNVHSEQKIEIFWRSVSGFYYLGRLLSAREKKSLPKHAIFTEAGFEISQTLQKL